MKILGIGCSSFHDPSAALLIDGQVVAAAEEERFSRNKHALGENPVQAARWCLEFAGVKPEELDLIAYPWSAEILREKRWEYAKRAFPKSPSKAIRAFTKLVKLQKKRVGALEATLRGIGLEPGRIPVRYVEHHLAHASSAFHLSGFPSAAVLTLDGEGEVTSSLFLEGLADGRLVKLKEILKPDSLGLFYATMTEYLGFDAMDGEYKVMGMAPYGDASRIDLQGMVRLTDDGYRCDDERVWVHRKHRWNGKHFSRRMVEELGPPRDGDHLIEPYVHVAAATQKMLEEVVLGLVEKFLKAPLERHGGRLCYAGGVALNVRLNRLLAAHPLVKELWVQPASSDAGIALGAATYVAVERGERIAPMETAALGPAWSTDECAAVLEKYKVPFTRVEDAPKAAAELLARGEVIAWFQGRMEWGPRALGQRSILGHPGKLGTADDINERIKFREQWRPFCPSVLRDWGPRLFDSEHDSPYMTLTFGVRPEWKERIPEVVHVDGSARPQYVTPTRAPRFHALLTHFLRLTGLPCVINTSLNRRGEPLICSPEDALRMFWGSGLEFLVMEDLLVHKRHEPPFPA